MDMLATFLAAHKIAAISLGAALLTWGLSRLSQKMTLQAIAALLCMSWLACNLVSEASRLLPSVTVFQQPVKSTIYALIDVVWLFAILWACRHGRTGKYIRWPLTGLYLIGLFWHVVIVFLYMVSPAEPAGVLNQYYTGLNVLYALELSCVSLWAGGALARHILFHRGGGLSLAGHFRRRKVGP